MYKCIKIIVIIFVLTSNACSKPKSKESYLKEYQSFILKVKNEWQTYTTYEWNKMTRINQQYNKHYYNIFLKEMSASEIIRVKRFNFAFLFYKGDITIKALISGKYNVVFKEYLTELNKINIEVLLGINDIRNEQLITVIDRLIQ